MPQHRNKPRVNVTLPPEVRDALKMRGVNISGLLTALAKAYCGIESDATEMHMMAARRIHALEGAINRISEAGRILSDLHDTSIFAPASADAQPKPKSKDENMKYKMPDPVGDAIALDPKVPGESVGPTLSFPEDVHHDKHAHDALRMQPPIPYLWRRIQGYQSLIKNHESEISAMKQSIEQLKAAIDAYDRR